MKQARSVDEYLSAISGDKRAALARLRSAIQAVVPGAEECISYQLPAFRLDGRFLVAYGAAARHCALYPGAAAIAAHAKALAGHDTSKGAVRFPPHQPLPRGLVRKLVKARIADIAFAAPGRKVRSSARKRAAKPRTHPVQTDPAVTAFLGELAHPLKRDIEAVREIILGVSPEVREGIKWNAPSFRTADYFATILLRATDRVQLILHRGAKVNDAATRGMKVADPADLVKWLAPERCLVTLGCGKEIRARRAALEALLRDWIRQL